MCIQRPKASVLVVGNVFMVAPTRFMTQFWGRADSIIRIGSLN
jgi:hypothetical protein